MDGIPAFERERCIISLIVLCRAIRPKPREQDRPWLPLASIRDPQAHMCGSHIAAPRRKPTATRTSSLSSLNPHAVIGKACYSSQSLACGDETAFNLAVLYGSIVCSNSRPILTVCSKRGLSHRACLCVGRFSASLISALDRHSDVMASKCVSGVKWREVRMRVWSGRVLAAEAKHSGSASEVALRIPRPPIFIGREACVHCRSVRDMFRIFSNPWRSVVSHVFNSGCLSQGWHRGL